MSDEAPRTTLARQVGQGRSLLVRLRQRGVPDVLDVRDHDALSDPRSVAERVRTFLVAEFDAVAVVHAVDGTLGREGRHTAATR